MQLLHIPPDIVENHPTEAPIAWKNASATTKNLQTNEI
jgi:hypothetical protein